MPDEVESANVSSGLYKLNLSLPDLSPWWWYYVKSYLFFCPPPGGHSLLSHNSLYTLFPQVAGADTAAFSVLVPDSPTA